MVTPTYTDSLLIWCTILFADANLLNPVLGEMSVDLRTNCQACRRRIKRTEFIVARDAMKTSK